MVSVSLHAGPERAPSFEVTIRGIRDRHCVEISASDGRSGLTIGEFVLFAALDDIEEIAHRIVDAVEIAREKQANRAVPPEETRMRVVSGG